MAQVYVVTERNEDGDVLTFVDAYRTLTDAHSAVTEAFLEYFDEEDRADLELPQITDGGSSMWVDGVTWYITAVALPEPL